ncbi:MAG: preprotein translocase subunit SecE [Actinomycetota bacterium]|nr:preprotein translocase subunit SecE [Actinomycetota bacterium]
MSDTTSSAAARPERGSPRPAERRNVFVRTALWYRQIVAELRKVVWPTRKELVAYTTVTLVFAVFMVALVAILDYGANWGVLKIFS